MSVKDAQFPHTVERTLLVSNPATVQIRLSALASTVGVLLIAIIAALASHVAVSRDTRSRDFYLPSSQIDWAVQAAREYRKSSQGSTATHLFGQCAAAYATENDGLQFVVSPGPDSRLTTWVRSVVKQTAAVQSLHPWYADPRFTYSHLDKSADTPTNTQIELV